MGWPPKNNSFQGYSCSAIMSDFWNTPKSNRAKVITLRGPQCDASGYYCISQCSAEGWWQLSSPLHCCSTITNQLGLCDGGCTMKCREWWERDGHVAKEGLVSNLSNSVLKNSVSNLKNSVWKCYSSVSYLLFCLCIFTIEDEGVKADNV